MARRGNGEGTITRRKDGRWEARYYVQTANGAKRKVLYGKTRAEARDKLAKALSGRIDGIVYDDENMTLGEYLDVWLKGSVLGSVRHSTYDRDTHLVNNHIKPVLGGVKLKRLNSVHLQSFYRNRVDARLSGSTVHKMHDILRRGLAQAVKWHLVPRNAAEAATPPRPDPKEMQALSVDEARRLLESAGEDRLEALYVLAIHTGMRQGELLALSWQDVDLENAVASVRRTLTRSGGKVVFGKPKTKKSRRSIRLTPQAVEALRVHLKRQLQDIEILGDRYQDQGLVFTTNTGAPINPSNLRQRSFASLLKRAGLPHMRFHDLRHTCATLLLSRGVHPKLVQELLDHATIAITLDTYSHVMPSMGDATAKALEDALA
jgi:integrase